MQHLQGSKMFNSGRHQATEMQKPQTSRQGAEVS